MRSHLGYLLKSFLLYQYPYYCFSFVMHWKGLQRHETDPHALALCFKIHLNSSYSVKVLWKELVGQETPIPTQLHHLKGSKVEIYLYSKVIIWVRAKVKLQLVAIHRLCPESLKFKFQQLFGCQMWKLQTSFLQKTHRVIILKPLLWNPWLSVSFFNPMYLFL